MNAREGTKKKVKKRNLPRFDWQKKSNSVVSKEMREESEISASAIEKQIKTFGLEFSPDFKEKIIGELKEEDKKEDENSR